MADTHLQRAGGSEPAPSSERILDAAIECTFPASDPIAVEQAFAKACAREREAKRGHKDI